LVKNMRHEAGPTISVAAEGDRREALIAVGGEVGAIIFATGSATEAAVKEEDWGEDGAILGVECRSSRLTEGGARKVLVVPLGGG
jgi:hypothetical protein